MCYAGGPYCYKTSQKRLERAKIDAAGSSSITAQKALREAQDDYDGTPTGQRELQERIEQSKVQGEREYLSLRKERTALIRKAKISHNPVLPHIEVPAEKDSGFQQIGMTPTGSRLYGTHHADSDYDYVTLYTDNNKTGHEKRKNLSQRLDGDDDVQRRSMDSFVRSCFEGSANDLDILYSTQWQYNDERYVPFLRSIRPDYTKARSKFQGYMGTYASRDDFKSTRHLFRVALNGRKLFTHGRYNPTHTDKELDFLNSIAKKHQHTETEKKMSLATDFMMGAKLR